MLDEFAKGLGQGGPMAVVAGFALWALVIEFRKVREAIEHLRAGVWIMLDRAGYMRDGKVEVKE